MTPISLPTTPVALAPCPVLSPERQLLWDAANYMERHGHSQTHYECDDGRVCMLGAIRRAAGHAPGDRILDNPAYSAVRTILASWIGPINVFNMENDQATVVAAMRQAALA